MSNFYCQCTCTEEDFSIDEWNETSETLDKTNLTEKEKNNILFPPQCESQCFDCMAVVGERRLKTKSLISGIKLK